MKKKSILMLSIILTIIFVISMLKPTYAASSFSITSGISSIEVGKKYSISINAKGLTGRFNISHSSNVSVNRSSIWVENGVPEGSISVTAKSAGKATVTFTPSNVANASNGSLPKLSAKTDTVTVKSKSSSNSNNSSSSSNSKPTNTNKEKTTKKPSFTSVNQTVYAKSQVNIRASYSTSSTILGSLNEGDSITRTGKSSEWSRVSYNGQTAYISSSYLTTEKPEESNNKNLKSLKVTPTGLSPKFSADVTSYKMTVGSDIDTIKVEAKAEDDKSKIEVSGNKGLTLGENIINIKVIAEDGTVRTYKINVTKQEKEQLKLSELTIAGVTLNPEFNPDIYEYTVELTDPNAKEIDITAVPSIEDASLEIAGDTDLKIGDNIVTVLVRADEGEEITTYQITVKVPEAGAMGADKYKLIAIGAAAFMVVLIIIIVAVKHKKNKEYEAYYGGFNFKDNEKEDIPPMGMELSEEDKPQSLRKKNYETDMDIDKLDEQRKKEIMDNAFGNTNNYFNDDIHDRPRRRGKHSK